MNTLFSILTGKHQLVLSSYIIEELLNVVRRKFSGKLEVVDTLLSQLPYELVYTPEYPRPGLFDIRNKKDYPVLYSAITEDVDIFITGDSDFYGLDIEKPEIMSISDFLAKYNQ